MIKRAINWILRKLFKVHIQKYPKPYKKKPRELITPDLLMQSVDQKRCPDHGIDYKKRCNVCRYIMGKIPSLQKGI